MNFAILENYYHDIWEGFLLTIYLSVIVLAISTPLAMLVALGRVFKIRLVSFVLAAYVTTFRALPALVILFFAFYALPSLGIMLKPFGAAIVGMCVTTTAYISEEFRAAILAVKKGQWEASKSLGLSPYRMIRKIILPQAASIFIPPYMTSAIITIKTTAIVSLIGVKELTGVTMAGITLTYSAMEFLAVATVLYLFLSAFLVVLQSYLEVIFNRHLEHKKNVEMQLKTGIA